MIPNSSATKMAVCLLGKPRQQLFDTVTLTVSKLGPRTEVR